jgi:hypothetical protein
MAYQEYPRVVYKPDGSSRVVQTAAEFDQAVDDGWQAIPPGAEPAVLSPTQPRAASRPPRRPARATKKAKKAKRRRRPRGDDDPPAD